MPRIWTWLGVLAMVAGAIGLADALSGPAPASAQPGSELSQPIPPADDFQRVGSVRNQIGWTLAKQRWGLNMPMGRDIPVAQVEAAYKGAYLADTKHRDLPGTGFIPESGATRTSSHATNVARWAFGPDSAGQGVRAVHGFEAGNWLTAGMLNFATDLPPKTDHPARVFNHSWIAMQQPGGQDALRRIDYLVDTRDLIMLVGVHNEPGPAPELLATAHNIISVGVISGKNTDGYTRTETPGRAKPEIVAPGGKTSWSCGVVTGCAAALLEVADRMVNEAEQAKDDKAKRNKDAARSEVIKAVLLAGAYKPDNWAPPEGVPLDKNLGAGVVDLDRSIIMLEAGHVEPGNDTTQRYGWSFAPVGSARQRTYRFTLDKPQGESTFALTWHRKIAGVIDGQWDDTPSTANLDLALFRINGEEGEEGEEKQELVAASTSAVDNVELIHTKSLEPGHYELRVGRVEDKIEEAWDYAVAWRIEAVVPEAGPETESAGE